jgi:hypothetical protein
MSILSDEIDNDPEGKGYAAFLPDSPGAVVDLLNDKTETATGIIKRADLARWAAKTGMRLVIQIEADNHESPLCPSALSIIDVLRGASDGIDLSIPDNAALLDAWQGLEKLSAEDRASMLALAQTPVSRATVLGLTFITEEMLRDR